MKIKIEVKFLKIDKWEITPEIIAKEKGLKDATIKCITDLANSLDILFFRKNGITPSKPKVSAEAKGDTLKGIIEFDILKIKGISINQKVTEQMNLKRFNKGMEGLVFLINKYFKQKNTITEVCFEAK